MVPSTSSKFLITVTFVVKNFSHLGKTRLVFEIVPVVCFAQPTKLFGGHLSTKKYHPHSFEIFRQHLLHVAGPSKIKLGRHAPLENFFGKTSEIKLECHASTETRSSMEDSESTESTESTRWTQSSSITIQRSQSMQFSKQQGVKHSMHAMQHTFAASYSTVTTYATVAAAGAPFAAAGAPFATSCSDCIPPPPPLTYIVEEDDDNALIINDAAELAAMQCETSFANDFFANNADGAIQFLQQDTADDTPVAGDMAGDMAGDLAGLDLFDDDKDRSFLDTIAVQSLLNPDLFDGQSSQNSSQKIFDSPTSMSKENAKTLRKQHVTYPSTPGPTFVQCFKTRQAKTPKQQNAKQQNAKEQNAKQQVAAPLPLNVAEQQKTQNVPSACAITLQVTARKGKPVRHFDEATVQSVMHLRQADASERLGISLSTLKKLCRQLHLQWPKKFPEELMQVSMLTTRL